MSIENNNLVKSHELNFSEKHLKPNPVKSNQLKKNDSSMKPNNVNATVNTTISASSTSSSGRVSQELINHQPTKKPTTTDLNFKVDSTNIDIEKNPVGVVKQFNILNNGQFNYKPNNNTTLMKETAPNR